MTAKQRDCEKIKEIRKKESHCSAARAVNYLKGKKETTQTPSIALHGKPAARRLRQ